LLPLQNGLIDQGVLVAASQAWTRGKASRTLTGLYNLACSHAELASVAAKPGSAITEAEGCSEADRAMEWLRQTVVAGYRKLAALWTDPSLDPLRSRPDFQLPMMDVRDERTWTSNFPITRSRAATERNDGVWPSSDQAPARNEE
jgi:hypothetical protein